MMQWFIALSVIFIASHHAVRADEFTANGCFAGSYAIDLAHESAGASNVSVFSNKTYIFDDYVFSCDGSIANYNFFASATGKFLALVFKPIRNEGRIHLVGFNEITVHTIGAQVQAIPTQSQVDVVVGDVLALAFPFGEVLSMGTISTSSMTSRLSKGCILDEVPPNVEAIQYFAKDYPSAAPFTGYCASITAFVQASTQYLRLSGTRPHDGMAEMFTEGKWGRICDKWFHRMGWPNIFCKALGFPENEKARHAGEHEIDYHANQYMNNLKCKASATKILFNCDRTTYDTCHPSYQVHVTCKRRVRLLNPINNDNCRGVPQIWKFGAWHTICDSVHNPAWHANNIKLSWTMAICIEMGCSHDNVTNISSFCAKDVISGYDLFYPKYPNPVCSVENPANILECPRQSGQTCSNDHDFFLECPDTNPQT